MIAPILAMWDRLWFVPRAPHALAANRMVLAYVVMIFLAGVTYPIPHLPLVNWRTLTSPNFTDPYAHYAGNDASTYFPTSFLDILNVPPPSQTALTFIYVVAFVSAWFLLLGLATRIAATTTALSVLYLLAMTNSWGKVNHGYHVLGVALLLLPFARSGDVWSLDAWFRRSVLGRDIGPIEPSWQYAWPVTAVQVGYALMFFFAGWNKLVASGPQWAFSENMRNTLIYQNTLVRDWETASWVVQTIVTLDNRWVWYALGVGGLLAELLLIAIVFMWHRRWIRRGLLMMAVGLVVGLDVLMQLPNPALLAMLLLFVDWNGVRTGLTGLFGGSASAEGVRTGGTSVAPTGVRSSA